MFISLVTKRVLDREVSNILIQASKELHQEEDEIFHLAVSLMQTHDLAFWVSPSDSQFWLDQSRYTYYRELKKELERLE